MRGSDFIFRYRVRNWPTYNRALVRRGSLRFWVDEAAVQGWRAGENSESHGRRPRIYFKALVGMTLAARGFENQQVEICNDTYRDTQ